MTPSEVREILQSSSLSALSASVGWKTSGTFSELLSFSLFYLIWMATGLRVCRTSFPAPHPAYIPHSIPTVFPKFDFLGILIPDPVNLDIFSSKWGWDTLIAIANPVFSVALPTT